MTAEPRAPRDKRLLSDDMIDPPPTEVLVIRYPDCPRADLHTPQPPTYLGWFSWASSWYGKGHRQRRCPGCGRYEVWT